MTDPHDNPPDVQASSEAKPQVVDQALLQAVVEALEAHDVVGLKALVQELEDADMADLVGLLEPEQRTVFIELLGPEFSPSVFGKLDWAVKDQLVEAIPNEQLAEVVKELETDDAVYVLEDLEQADQAEILARLPAEDRAALERSLEYPEDSAGRLMSSEFIAVPPFWTVGQTIDFMRDTDDLPERFTELYVVDAAYHVIGTVALDRLLRTKRPVPISAIMSEEVHTIPAGLDQEEVARQFERYNLTAAGVVDDDKRLVGIITADDVMEILEEEVEEDLFRLAGVGHESVTETVLTIVRSRVWWLVVNLGTASLAAMVIGLFDATIEQMVALAVLMPIVASMGGNAGTQTMTVAVRALATRELGSVNAMRMIGREAMVGIVNGLLFAVILAGVAIAWFGSGMLGLVIATAILINLLAAGLAGILIPLALDRLKIDPAVASSVFVTMITDVVGFFAFLGLGTLWLF